MRVRLTSVCVRERERESERVCVRESETVTRNTVRCPQRIRTRAADGILGPSFSSLLLSSRELSNTQVYEPYIRTLLGTQHFCARAAVGDHQAGTRDYRHPSSGQQQGTRGVGSNKVYPGK